MMKNILYLLVVLFFFCSSCGDFLEEYSQNSTYVESVDDLDELLLGGGYLTRNVGSISATGAMAYLHIMADESKEMPVPNSSVSKSDQVWEKMAGFYIWAENPFTSYTVLHGVMENGPVSILVSLFLILSLKRLLIVRLRKTRKENNYLGCWENVII